jgi:hypothetical protein
LKFWTKFPKISLFFFSCRASSYKPPSSRENNILPSLPLGSLGVVSLITSVYTYRGDGGWSPQQTLKAMRNEHKLRPRTDYGPISIFLKTDPLSGEKRIIDRSGLWVSDRHLAIPNPLTYGKEAFGYLTGGNGTMADLINAARLEKTILVFR